MKSPVGWAPPQRRPRCTSFLVAGASSTGLLCPVEKLEWWALAWVPGLYSFRGSAGKGPGEARRLAKGVRDCTFQPFSSCFQGENCDKLSNEPACHNSPIPRHLDGRTFQKAHQKIHFDDESIIGRPSRPTARLAIEVQPIHRPPLGGRHSKETTK